MNLEVGPVLRTLRRQPGVWLLVVFELAAGVATISALLLAGSWYGAIARAPSGLDEENLVAIATYTPHPAATDAERPAAEARVLGVQAADRARILAVPQVTAVTTVSTSVLDDRWSFPSLFRAESAARQAPGRQAVGWAVYADAGWAATLGLPFLAGAAPGAAAADAAPAPVAAVLTRQLATALFGDPAAAVGASISSELHLPVPVVGVVGDAWMRMPFMPSGRAAAFLFGGAPHQQDLRLIARARPGQRDAAVAALRAAFAPDQATRFVDVRPFQTSSGVHYRVGKGLDGMLRLFGFMLGTVMLLGALATTSFVVAQRTRTIGVRRALGATKADIVGYFLVESALATTAGSLLGVAGAAVLYPMMRRVFSGIVFDLRLVALALALLWVASLLATLIPALRAARVPPSVASRSP